jgi:acyl-CoA thioester hydrolase
MRMIGDLTVPGKQVRDDRHVAQHSAGYNAPVQREPDRAQPFSWQVRVYYEDVDIGGVVYYANYLRYFERARSEWLRSLGVNQERLAAVEGVGFVVVRAEIDYKIGARLDDLLTVTVIPTEMKRAYFWLDQDARLPDGRVCATARIKAACVRHRDMQPQPIPEIIAAVLKPGLAA